ncbi:MAG: GntR family transcriptional regulator [Natronosporangium sp.]
MHEIERVEPPYAQVVAYIRGQIQSGDLKPGDMIPSARRITQDWTVSLATATKVLAALRSEGLVEARTGIGTVVSTGATDRATPRDRAVSTRRTGRIYAPGEYAKITSAELVPAPVHVAEVFGVAPDSPVIRRRRVTYRDEVPMSASTSWFDCRLAETAPQLLSTERITQGTWRYVEEVTERIVSAGRDQLSAAEAAEQESTDLGVALGSSVLRGRNWYLDSDGSVIEYGESVARPDRWSTYEYEISN